MCLKYLDNFKKNYTYVYIFFFILGYGDSDPADLSELGVVTDSKYVVQWLINKVNNSAPIFVWGHSLGTGYNNL